MADPVDRDVEIRTHDATEWPDVLAVIDRAFAPDVAAGLLADWIHGSDGWTPDLSHVAVVDGDLVGHVMVSRLPLRTSTGTVPILCLSPLSVEPAHQGRGIARALVGSVLAAAAATRAEPFVVLEGSPRMYPKFGFLPASEYGIERPSELIPEPAFQLVTLPGYRPGVRGRVEYPDYFFDIGAVGP